jgi:hypothetical protein
MNISKQSGFFAMLRSSDFLMYFSKQAGSGFESESGSESGFEIKVKVGYGSGKNNFRCTTLLVKQGKNVQVDCSAHSAMRDFYYCYCVSKFEQLHTLYHQKRDDFVILYFDK